ncbi:unnamed protein product [Adineta steineri]|uniref:Uncharacterized protein n=1 Tax=Adineta steineri TaxID=433720 RepID=A0A814ZNG0_9BILA|nr:unnamed protein product [Adineta steineri]
MECHDPQESGCDLQLMTSCRDTPPIQTISQETCLGQILGSLPLSICETIVLPPAKFFVRPLRDNLYVTSSSEPLHCLNIPETEYSVIRQQTLNMNEQIILSPVALANVTPGYTFAYSRFNLVGRPLPSSAPSLAPILVYRNELRTELNNRAVVNRAYEMGRSPTVVIATDTIKAKKHIDLPDLAKRLLALPDNKTEHLPGYLPLVPGMPVLLQENIACELGLSNGTQGIFCELVYDHSSELTTGSDEERFTTDTVFVRNAQYALVEVPKSKLKNLDSLDPFIIPIPVIEKTFDINLEKLYADKGAIMKMFKDKKLKATISVKRKALPLIPAYSITTHKSQGQTLPKIVIDLNMPPGMVEVASAYVPLSRVEQLTDLVILQDFNISALQVKPSKGQITEVNRLAVLFQQTKQRYAQYFL